MKKMGHDFVEEVCATVETGVPKFDIDLVIQYQREFYAIDWDEKDYHAMSSPGEAFMMGDRYKHFESYCTQSCYSCGNKKSLRPNFSVAKSVWYYECEQHRSKK
jgi:hypothetical protein